MTGLKKYVADNPKLLAEWDYEKNSEIGFYPDCITLGSNKKVWWICTKGHSWLARISSRNRGMRNLIAV